jgi:hypothetical protein
MRPVAIYDTDLHQIRKKIIRLGLKQDSVKKRLNGRGKTLYINGIFQIENGGWFLLSYKPFQGGFSALPGSEQSRDRKYL